MVYMEFSMEFQGYGQVSLQSENVLLPPTPLPPPNPDTAPKLIFTRESSLTEPEARRALFNFARSKKPYLGTKCAQEMGIRDIKQSSILVYTLETLFEGRETRMMEQPYKGEPLDGPSTGPPPPPWSIQCSPDMQFEDHRKLIEVPHTAMTVPCYVCGKLGYDRCESCLGNGKVKCSMCTGLGSHGREPCDHCSGVGRVRCTKCMEDGRVTCEKCKGFGQLKRFVQLTVTFKLLQTEEISRNSDMPSDLASSAPGVTILQQTLQQVLPISDYPVKDINEKSQQLVQLHRTCFPNKLLKHQRQTLRAVPVSEVHYTWEKYHSRFWAYGTESAVYAPDYPDHDCCTII